MVCTKYCVLCAQKRNVYILEGIIDIVFNGKKQPKNENPNKKP